MKSSSSGHGGNKGQGCRWIVATLLQCGTLLRYHARRKMRLVMVRVNHDINMLRHTFETLQLIWLVGINQMLFIVLHDVDWLVTRKTKA